MCFKVNSQSWLQERCIINKGPKLNKITAYISTLPKCNLDDISNINDTMIIIRAIGSFDSNGNIITSIEFSNSEKIKEDTFIYFKGRLINKYSLLNKTTIIKTEFKYLDNNLTEVTQINNTSISKYYLQNNSKGQQITNFILNSNGDTISIRYINYDERNLPLSISYYENGVRKYLKIYVRNAQGEIVQDIICDEKGIKIEDSTLNKENIFFDKFGNIIKLITWDNDNSKCVIWYYEIEYHSKEK